MAKRSKAIRKELGLPDKPEECDLCSQSEGVLQWHNEDYDHPINDLWGLCWRCHMMWHSRRRAPDQVREYFKAVNEGVKFAPVYKHDFGILWREHGVGFGSRSSESSSDKAEAFG